MTLAAITRSLQWQRHCKLPVGPVYAGMFPDERYEAEVMAIAAGRSGLGGQAGTAGHDAQYEKNNGYRGSFQLCVVIFGRRSAAY